MKRTLTLFVAMMAVAALPSVALAVSYASGACQVGSTVSFTLNQGAGNVTVELDGGASSIDLGALAKGCHGVDVGAAASWCIKVSSSAGAGYKNYNQISDDSANTSIYYTPKGVTVDKNPLSPYFGRIYVGEAAGGLTGAGRTTTDGIYVLGADGSDITVQGDAAYGGGVDWSTSSSSPFKLSLNQTDAGDHSVFISDWSDSHSGIWTADASNMGAAFNELLDNTGRATSGLVLEGGGVGPAELHGSVPCGPWVEGSGANRKMLTVDEDVRLGNVLQYDIGTATSGYNVAPTDRTTSDGTLLNGNMDLVRDADGNFWISQYRYTDSDSVSALSKWADGGTAPDWKSGPSTFSLNYGAGYAGLDILELDDLCDGGTLDRGLIVVGAFGKFFIVDISTTYPKIRAEIAVDGATRTRDVSFDAAGNVYVVSNYNELLKVYSPGGDWYACTCSDGTFNVVPEPASLALLALGGLALLRRRR